MKQWYADHTNPDGVRGTVSEVIAGADLFVGLSVPGMLTVDDIKRMARDPIVFAMSNPIPAVADPHVAIMATGRSDYPNQINNVLAFPGIFRGALDVGARQITLNMKLAASRAIAELVAPERLGREYIVPSPFDRAVAPAVAKAVAAQAIADGVARPEITVPLEYERIAW